MRHWIFKCNPKFYRLKDRLDDPEDIIDWRVPQFTNQVKPGDFAFLWWGGSKKVILGIMQIEEEATISEDSEIDKGGREWRYYVNPDSEWTKRISHPQPRVVGKLIVRNVSLRTDELKAVNSLERLSALVPGIVATVYWVERTEGVILARLALENLRKLNKPYLKKLIVERGPMLAQFAGFSDEEWGTFERGIEN
jgi:predicted RNA-binding protein with PUA-like domain